MKEDANFKVASDIRTIHYRKIIEVARHCSKALAVSWISPITNVLMDIKLALLPKNRRFLTLRRIGYEKGRMGCIFVLLKRATDPIHWKRKIRIRKETKNPKILKTQDWRTTKHYWTAAERWLFFFSFLSSPSQSTVFECFRADWRWYFPEIISSNFSDL